MNNGRPLTAVLGILILASLILSLASLLLSIQADSIRDELKENLTQEIAARKGDVDYLMVRIKTLQAEVNALEIALNITEGGFIG